MRGLGLMMVALMLVATTARAHAQNLERGFDLPIACPIPLICTIQNFVDVDPGPGHQDFDCSAASYDGHTGTDFRIPDLTAMALGFSVIAPADGVVLRTRDGQVDQAQRDPLANGRDCGNGVVLDHGGGWQSQLCHMRRGSVAVTQGQRVLRGEVLGMVGLSGRTEFPHVHWVVRHNGRVLDPFTGAEEGAGCRVRPRPLWTAEAQAQLGRETRPRIYGGGFAGQVVSIQDVDRGVVEPTRQSPLLVGYGRGIRMRRGDHLYLRLEGPDGFQTAEQAGDPFPAPQAQYVSYVGRRRPPSGFPRGRYRLTVQLRDANGLVVDQVQWDTRL